MATKPITLKQEFREKILDLARVCLKKQGYADWVENAANLVKDYMRASEQIFDALAVLDDHSVSHFKKESEHEKAELNKTIRTRAITSWQEHYKFTDDADIADIYKNWLDTDSGTAILNIHSIIANLDQRITYKLQRLCELLPNTNHKEAKVSAIQIKTMHEIFLALRQQITEAHIKRIEIEDGINQSPDLQLRELAP